MTGPENVRWSDAVSDAWSSRIKCGRRNQHFGSIANVLAWLSFVGGFLVGARSEVAAYMLFGAFAGLACASIYFRQWAKRALTR